jgi:hypothetical protein
MYRLAGYQLFICRRDAGDRDIVLVQHRGEMREDGSG